MREIDNSFRSQKEVRYSDLDARFLVNPNTNDFGVVKNVESIKQHIRLLFIDHGILFRPDTDSQITANLFDNWNFHTQLAAENKLRFHLNRFEPRIEILELSVDFNHDKQSLNIDLKYQILEEKIVLNFTFLIKNIR